MLGPLARAYREAFSGLPRPVWKLCAVSLLNRCGTMVMPFLALYLTRELGRSRADAGLALALWGVGGMVGSAIGGWAADRFGQLRVQALALWAGGAGFVLLGQLRSFAAVAAGIFVVAVVSDSVRPPMLAAVAAAAPPHLRTRALALLRLASNLGFAVGPAVGGFLALTSYGWLFVIDGATSWAAAGLLVAGLRGERRQERAARRSEGRGGGPSPLRDVPFLGLTLLFLLLVTVLYQVFTTAPLYYRQVLGFHEDRIGLLFALSTAVIVLAEMVLVRFAERFDAGRVAALGSFLLCAGFALLPFGSRFAWVAFTVLVWTTGEMLALPFTNALVALRAGPGNLGRYMGLYTIAASLAAAVAPVAGTAIWDRWGAAAPWRAAGALGVALGVGFALLAPALRRPPAAAAAG
jgi:predicted MFS family arabinose efflux permease